MSCEPRRGCGYRKIGGLYLVGAGHPMPCDRFPIEMTVCPTCSQGIKQARGWTWLNINDFLHGVHAKCQDQFPCPLCMNPDYMGRAGLLWIGERFYKTPRHFNAEATMLGISRRIHTVPRGFEIGKTWVLLAHPRVIECPACGGAGRVSDHETLDYAACVACDSKGAKPAIFYCWRPSAIEKILPESQRDSQEAQDLQKRGITPVYFPDSDPDHKGSVYDDEESED
jgi:hypothetical protein